MLTLAAQWMPLIFWYSRCPVSLQLHIVWCLSSRTINVSSVQHQRQWRSINLDHPHGKAAPPEHLTSCIHLCSSRPPTCAQRMTANRSYAASFKSTSMTSKEYSVGRLLGSLSSALPFQPPHTLFLPLQAHNWMSKKLRDHHR